MVLVWKTLFVLKSQHLGTTRLSCLFPISAPVLHEGLCVEGAGVGGLLKPHLNHCISWRVSTVKDCKSRWDSSMTTELPTKSLTKRTKGPRRGLVALMIPQWDVICLVLPPNCKEHHPHHKKVNLLEAAHLRKYGRNPGSCLQKPHPAESPCPSWKVWLLFGSTCKVPMGLLCSLSLSLALSLSLSLFLR